MTSGVGWAFVDYDVINMNFFGAPLLAVAWVSSSGLVVFGHGYEALLCGRTGRAGDAPPGCGGASGGGAGAPHVCLWPFPAEKGTWHTHMINAMVQHASVCSAAHAHL